MRSVTKKRIIWGIVGSVYAAVYGLWTMIATGGGHLNFIWSWLFISVGFLGLYFPLMAILAVDLKSVFSKIIFALLIGFNLVASMILIYGWVKEPATDRASDFERALRANGIEGLLFCAAAHFFPTFIFAFLLIRSIVYGNSSSEDSSSTGLHLS